MKPKENIQLELFASTNEVLWVFQNLDHEEPPSITFDIFVRWLV